jgi:thiol-disulfide isomerase/thioredoxin
MKKLTTLFILSFILGSLNVYARISHSPYKLTVETENKKYDKMFLKIKGNNFQNEIQGIKSTNTAWTFTIPDSLYERHFQLFLSGYVATAKHYLDFTISKKKFLTYFSIAPNSIMKLHYLSSDTVPIPNYDANGKFFTEKRYYDSYKVINPDMEMKAAFVFSFESRSLHDESHQQVLSSHLSLIHQYADTHYCVSNLYQLLGNTKNKADISTFYQALSPRRKKSYFGSKINKYLTMSIFPKILLPTTIGGQSENVIPDATRYTLVIFSTSWCGPCHKQIPLLLKTYDELKNYPFDMVYISMDDSVTVKNWPSVIEKYKIPWKSFLAVNQTEKIQNFFAGLSYPTSYLVYPGGKFENIDIRKQEGKERLYKIVRGNK